MQVSVQPIKTEEAGLLIWRKVFLRAEQDKSLVLSIITMFVLPVPVIFIDLLTDFQIKNTSISIHPDSTEL